MMAKSCSGREAGELMQLLNSTALVVTAVSASLSWKMQLTSQLFLTTLIKGSVKLQLHKAANNNDYHFYLITLIKNYYSSL